MRVRKFAATAALITAATIAGSASPAGAAPIPIPGPAHGSATPATGVNYRGAVENGGKSATVVTDAGSLVVENNVFKVKAADGTVLAGTPLALRVDQFEFPISAQIVGRKATLTPQIDMAHAVYKPVALPFEDQAPWKTPYDRELAAFTRMQHTITTVGVIGPAFGLIGGGIIGCGLGALVGTAVTGILLALFGAGPVAGCLAGAGIGAALGGVVGALLVTAPVAIAAVGQYFATINAPFVRPHYPS